ncbi:MAG: DUF3052 family protein [Pyrinomonadaceae bacterium]|nr:DUF3052 family protein [Pyrinomonadaceae bacterium]
MKVVTLDEPENYLELVDPMPEGVNVTSEQQNGADILHIFTNSHDSLLSALTQGRTVIRQDGAIWVSWYKKASKLPTEITEDTIREAALALGLVDVKVCAVDEKWSGLKLVIRKENRI